MCKGDYNGETKCTLITSSSEQNDTTLHSEPVKHLKYNLMHYRKTSNSNSTRKFLLTTLPS